MERCDGNRNILHACISMCSPTSNKENDQGIKYIFCICNLHKL